ncbi:MAG TPA: hypothetical protein VFH97_08820 [Gemmatimonadales bacterium]|nr:hypothetical protein [Gemmatimonadales bacterium]
MMKKLSSGAQQDLEVVIQARRKLDRLHTLVEQFSVAKMGPAQDGIAAQITRAALELGRSLLQIGLGPMADQANQLGMLARRGGGPAMKLRSMRDYVAQLRPGLERAERTIVEKDAKAPAGDENA